MERRTKNQLPVVTQADRITRARIHAKTQGDTGVELRRDAQIATQGTTNTTFTDAIAALDARVTTLEP